ncbi:hypothetical protein EKO04_010204 [Ascochyta lentis]|uniref:Uncharacterized protein n=1 Tax=Ascochyta lentis TaxID=205686 RepID=A0A8H7ITL1_9PLEO|nr:hypothetical protein EKO04_010204 [Ascochyta lentis]
MTAYPTSSSVDEVAPTTTTPHAKSVSQAVGSFGQKSCWELDETDRNYFLSKIKPEILQQLDGLFQYISPRDLIVMTAYMVGNRLSSAVPTVLFISQNRGPRMDAHNTIRKSGMLNQHPGWKTDHHSKDPLWGLGRLKTLALGRESNAYVQKHEPVTQVFYDTSKPLRSEGMTVYIPHGPSLRVATANLVRVHGQMFYLTAAHAFFDRNNTPEDTTDESDDESEIDSDDEFEMDSDDGDPIVNRNETIDNSVTELCRVQEDDAWSSSGESMESESCSLHASEEGDDYSLSSFGSSALPGIGGVTVHHGPTHGASSQSIGAELEMPPHQANEDSTILRSMIDFIEATADEMQTQPTLSEQETKEPCLASLQPFGVLSRWSTDKDWALIAVNGSSDSDLAAFLATDREDLSTMPVARCNTGGAFVLTHTTSGGKMTGTMFSTLSDYRPPHGTSFQEVYSIRLDGRLADGDCGSAVTDAATGELYGHIVAGCEDTGFAYVMAARHVFPDLQKDGIQKTDLHSISDNGTSDEQVPDTRQELDAKDHSIISANATNAMSNASQTTPYSDYLYYQEKNSVFDRRALFENIREKKPEIPGGYEKVEVLILRWDGTNDDDAAKNAEVEQLRHVFERYGFGCNDVKLSMEDENPQYSLDQAVLRHVSAHNDPNSLLIVYYTGHGLETERGQANRLKRKRSYENSERLSMIADKTSIRNAPSELRQTSLGEVSWDAAEAPLLSASADVLTILDNCSASTAVPRVMGNNKVYERLTLDERLPHQNRTGPISSTLALCRSFEILFRAGFPSLTAMDIEKTLTQVAQMGTVDVSKRAEASRLQTTVPL